MGEAATLNGSPADQEPAAEPVHEVTKENTTIDWNDDPLNPLNWPSWKKVLQVVMLSSAGILALVLPVLN